MMLVTAILRFASPGGDEFESFAQALVFPRCSSHPSSVWPNLPHSQVLIHLPAGYILQGDLLTLWRVSPSVLAFQQL